MILGMYEDKLPAWIELIAGKVQSAGWTMHADRPNATTYHVPVNLTEALVKKQGLVRDAEHGPTVRDAVARGVYNELEASDTVCIIRACDVPQDAIDAILRNAKLVYYPPSKLSECHEYFEFLESREEAASRGSPAST